MVVQSTACCHPGPVLPSMADGAPSYYPLSSNNNFKIFKDGFLSEEMKCFFDLFSYQNLSFLIGLFSFRETAGSRQNLTRIRAEQQSLLKLHHSGRR